MKNFLILAFLVFLASCASYQGEPVTEHELHQMEGAASYRR